MDREMAARDYRGHEFGDSVFRERQAEGSASLDVCDARTSSPLAPGLYFFPVTQPPRGVGEIDPQRLERRYRLQLVPFLAQAGRVPELTPRRGGRVLRGKALTHVAFREQPEVLVDFRIERAIVGAAEQGTQALDAASPGTAGHVSRSRQRMRPMTPAIRCQSSVSRASCFMPRRVIE
jgi:hypothetical protein